MDALKVERLSFFEVFKAAAAEVVQLPEDGAAWDDGGWSGQFLSPTSPPPPLECRPSLKYREEAYDYFSVSVCSSSIFKLT